MNLVRTLMAGAVIAAACLSVASCSLNFLNTGGPALNLQNDTGEDLTFNFEGQTGRRELSAGGLADVAISEGNCDRDTLVVYSLDGQTFATLTDERLCDNNTLVVVRGENDIEIEDR